MRRCVGLRGAGQLAVIEFLYQTLNGNGLSDVDFNSCSRQRLHRIRAAMPGNHGFSTFGGNKLGSLNARTAAQCGIFVVEDFKTHIVRFDDYKITAPAKSGIRLGGQILPG
jgi:hypothetical protein